MSRTSQLAPTFQTFCGINASVRAERFDACLFINAVWVGAGASAALGVALSSPCMLSFGGCGCVFHHHCLSPWLQKRAVCPVDEIEWRPAPPRLCAGLTGDATAAQRHRAHARA
eukprot:6202577-Pleurochrysis_carterae.AAC.3